MDEIIEIKTEHKIDISTFADHDIFLYDDFKIIHLATAGMTLIKSLEEFDPNIDNLKTILNYRRSFKTLINENLERDNITELNYYQSSFKFMSKRGFYSYDKFDIDDPDDYRFQLISKPFYNNKKIILKDNKYNNIELGDLNSSKTYNYDLYFLRAKNNFPENFNVFDLSEYI